VLWLAWTLADLTSPSASGEGLGTSVYLASLLGDTISPAWLPTLVFLLASAVAYCTGTSWGTMSILVPLVIPLAWKMLGGTSEARYTPLFSLPLLAVFWRVRFLVITAHRYPIRRFSRVGRVDVITWHTSGRRLPMPC
jgi:Na+/H+ antiporter NhaC